MQIAERDTVVEGEHLGRKFVLRRGYLYLLPVARRYSLKEIRILWELGQLLKLEGYSIRETLPKPKKIDHPFFGEVEIEGEE